MPHRFKKILIANRGEIALRIARTCETMGIAPVTLHAVGEETLPHAKVGEGRYSLGKGTLAETYLNQEKLIDIAKKAGVDAIHPGYGFLSENASFCAKVKAAGLVFIGPSAEVIKLMGDKIASRQCVEKIGVPVIPGYNGASQDEKTLKKEADRIGYPLLIKASAGGGGKGMRLVENAKDFAAALQGAQGEALNAFGNGTVYLEKYIEAPRHIEIQVFSDQHGNHVHLFERECSIQRRHQKIVEETPSTAVNADLRRRMTETAVNIAKHIGYEGAGTLEFMVDKHGSFYFLEMNTRLQVEHPVTEMVTGLDLVEWQIRVAQGEALPLKQEAIKQNGHAIEVRLYAEDPENNFLPTTGKIMHIGQSDASHVRLDSGYADGNSVSINYDPMLAKLAAWGKTREEAASRLEEALGQVVFAGIKTNRDYLRHILVSEPFLNGQTQTDFVQKNASLLAVPEFSAEQLARYIAGYIFSRKHQTSQERAGFSPWHDANLAGFRNV